MNAPMNAQTCRYFQRRICAGCTLIDEPYAAQLLAKRAYVVNSLDVVPEAAARCQSVRPSPSPMGYRASVKLALSQDRTGRRAVGIYRPGGKDVAHVPDCPAQTAGVSALVKRMLHRREAPPAPYYDHRWRTFQKGRLKYLVVRGDNACVLAHTGVERQRLTQWLTAAGLGDLCVYESRLTPADGDRPIGRHIAHLSGPEFFSLRLGAHTYALDPTAFFQANEALGPQLVAAAARFSAPGDVLLDLYGGFGAYSFTLADRFKKIFIVDGNPGAVRAAERHAKDKKFTHVQAHATTCEAFLQHDLAPADAARTTHAIVNPPRNGLSSTVLDMLSSAKMASLRDINYVSCNPESLARDLRRLSTAGFAATTVQPFDMFPQTEHVEVVVELRR